jgi:hypothetical protein
VPFDSPGSHVLPVMRVGANVVRDIKAMIPE